MANRLKERQFESIKAVEKADKAVVEKLAEKAKHGNDDALYSLCQTIAKGVLFRMSCKLNPMDAEDATQNVLLIVCTSIHTLREPKAFGGWLNSIIMHEIRQHAASKAKQADVVNMETYLENIVEESDDFLPSEYVIKEEDRKAVMEIVRGLPERQSEAVMLHYYEGMSITETAEAMGVARQNVNRYLVLARDKIKNSLQKQARSNHSLYSISLLPIGGLLVRVLHDEAALLPIVNEAVITNAVSSSSVSSESAAAKAARTSAFLLGVLPAIVFSIVTAIILVGGLFAGSLFPNQETPSIEKSEIIRDKAMGTVLFSGGVRGYEYINPTQAEVQTGSELGEMTIHSWSITTMGGNNIIYEGKGYDANNALSELSIKGEDGEYEIIFSLEDGAHDTYILRRSFFIQKDKSSL